MDDDTDYTLSAPCGCPDCSLEVQPGHFACSTVSDRLLHREKVGLVMRVFDSGGVWRWVVAYTGFPRWRQDAARREA